ncbi:MAG: hypothetical protein V2J10_12615, partial [Wenzhouxiangella sp.]|nr:hypothetical protein [Wenzhouxiangella sp.]
MNWGNQQLVESPRDRFKRGRIDLWPLHQDSKTLDEDGDLIDWGERISVNAFPADHNQIAAMLAKTVIEQTRFRIKVKVGRVPSRAELKEPFQAWLRPNGGRHQVKTLLSKFAQSFMRIRIRLRSLELCCRSDIASHLSPEIRQITHENASNFASTQNPIDIDPLKQGAIAIALQKTYRLGKFTAVDQELRQTAKKRLVFAGETGQCERAATKLVELKFQSVDRLVPLCPRT